MFRVAFSVMPLRKMSSSIAERLEVRVSRLEESLSAQSSLFPLPWLYANTIGEDIAVEDMGTDSFDGVSAKHLRVTKTFVSNKSLQIYSKFTVRNIWLDQNSGLPLKIGFNRRTALGAAPPVAIALEYSDYRPIQGYLYPFHIRKYVNGTLWADIHVQSVQFNTGIAASEFSTQ